MTWFVLCLYIGASALFLRHFIKAAAARPEQLHSMVKFLVLAHGVLLLGRTLGMVQVYRQDVFEVMAWLPMLLFWWGSRKGHSLKLLLLIAPLSILLLLIAGLMENKGLLSVRAMEHTRSVFLHIVLAMGAFSSFLLVSLCACMYLWQRFLLKKHRTAQVLKWMPSLVELTAIQWRILFTGIALFTLAIGLGKLSPYLWGIPHQWGGKELLSVMIWSIYVLLALLRKPLLVHKDWFAYGALLGLLLVMCTFCFLDFSAGASVAGGAQL